VLLLRRQLMSRVEGSLRPLFWGQIFQMLVGIAFIVLGVACWAPNQGVPHRLVSGILLHVYGVLIIISAGMLSSKIRRLDYSKSVAGVRDQLNRIRLHYLRWGAFIGFAWWLLWIPVAVAVGFEAIMYPIAFWQSIGVGVIGLVITLALYWRVLQSEKPAAQRVARALIGESLSNAYVALDEIESVEMH
jgi:serine/threonine-protein kinase